MKDGGKYMRTCGVRGFSRIGTIANDLRTAGDERIADERGRGDAMGHGPCALGIVELDSYIIIMPIRHPEVHSPRHNSESTGTVHQTC